jgi:formyltetrahydrofolate deformylase
MSPKSTPREYILLLSCPDTRGIVHSVSGVLLAQGCNILESTQHGDLATGLFCMRVVLVVEEGAATLESLRTAFAPVAAKFNMTWQIADAARRARVLIMVSRHDHCLHDLLYRYRKGSLAMDIPAVVSNHRDTYQLVAAHNIPFHHLPVTAETKAQREAELLAIVEQAQIDFLILARYMQVLSDDVCRKLTGRVINIHHSFLPGFKGARPYEQAFERGVKLIGATAHYVTGDLDEGPIIEQGVARVDHNYTAERLAEVGRDIEQQVLARAVKLQLAHRIVLVGRRTVVFQ